MGHVYNDLAGRTRNVTPAPVVRVPPGRPITAAIPHGPALEEFEIQQGHSRDVLPLLPESHLPDRPSRVEPGPDIPRKVGFHDARNIKRGHETALCGLHKLLGIHPPITVWIIQIHVYVGGYSALYACGEHIDGHLQRSADVRPELDLGHISARAVRVEAVADEEAIKDVTEVPGLLELPQAARVVAECQVDSPANVPAKSDIHKGTHRVGLPVTILELQGGHVIEEQVHILPQQQLEGL